MEMEKSLVIASGISVSNSLSQHFGYEVSDKKAKSSLIKSANREAFEIQERQKCVMMDLSTGAYHELVIPNVEEWKKGEKSKIIIQDLSIEIVEVCPGYDEAEKHVQSIVRFVVNSNKVTVTCYNTTQRIKVEGKGYLEFVEKFLKPFFINKLSKAVHERIDNYNKEVIAALSGKRKAVSRPMRSVRYKALAQLPCSKCDLFFMNDVQLKKHKTRMHTKGGNDSTLSISNVLIPDDITISCGSDDEEYLASNTVNPQEPLQIEYSELKKETARSFKCNQCNFEANLNNLLGEHIVSTHTEADNKIYFSCDECNQMFQEDEHMKEHQKEHYNGTFT